MLEASRFVVVEENVHLEEGTIGYVYCLLAKEPEKVCFKFCL